MKRYQDTIAYTWVELVDLLGGQLFNELNRTDEFGIATCDIQLFGEELIYLQDRFSPKALDAIRNALGL